MTCPDCGAGRVRFAVPPSLREHAPDGAATVAICSSCLRTTPAVGGDAPAAEPDFDALDPTFPTGEAGIALALALGHLGSLALHRGDVRALCEHAEAAGADVFLVLDRLEAAAEAGDVDPHFDLERRRADLADVLS